MLVSDGMGIIFLDRLTPAGLETARDQQQNLIHSTTSDNQLILFKKIQMNE
jgi:hypothetical protein